MLQILVDATVATSFTLNETKDPTLVSRSQQFLWGMGFSTVGDGCLVFRRAFMVGVISFAISLCFYINVLGLVESLMTISAMGVVCGLCIFAFSTTIAVVFKRLLDKSYFVKIPARSRCILSTLMLFYFLILSTLLWSAVLLLLRQNSRNGICAAIGAVMFYTSDLLIAATAIFDLRLLQGRALVMLTYYAAQLFLALSLGM